MGSRLGLLCATATWALAPSAAFAQTAKSDPPAGGARAAESQVQGGETVADIIVTANRRSERLQDVPITVTAVDGETLRERGVQNPEDLSRVAPSLVTQNNASNAQGTNFSIRGVGTSSF